MKNISTGLVILAVFMLIGYAFSINQFDVQRLNVAIYDFFGSTRSNDGVAVMRQLTRIGESEVLFPLSGAALLAFFFLRKWKLGMIFAIGVWMTDLLTNYTKVLFNIPRPLDKLIGTGGYSFPSGHVSSAAIVFGVIAVGLVPLIKRYPRVRILCWTLCGLAVALVGISRLYLNVHWFSDVIGGILLPIGIIFLLIGAGEKIENMGR
ncbi:MAG: phosphatase PAP2 family protein [Patescibacteria group bacterium]